MPEVCLILMNFNKLLGRSHLTDKSAVGADLSSAPPIYRPKDDPQRIPVKFLNFMRITQSVTLHKGGTEWKEKRILWRFNALAL